MPSRKGALLNQQLSAPVAVGKVRPGYHHGFLPFSLRAVQYELSVRFLVY